MKLQYLGTAAAEGIPALFCDCEVCRLARERGGRNVRSRPQAMIDDALLIDLGPDTLFHSLTHGIDLTHIEHCLVTHIHEDHLSPFNLFCRRHGFANLAPETRPLTVWGSRELGEFLGADKQGNVNPDGSVLFRHAPLYTPSTVGDYEVTALPALHGTREPYNYIIRNTAQDKTLLYAHDTFIWQDEAVWQYLTESKTVFDAVSLDCTYANSAPTGIDHHMCLTDNQAMRDRLIAVGAANERTVFICNHFSHNGDQSLYDDFSLIAADKGFLTSYDGMTLEF